MIRSLLKKVIIRLAEKSKWLDDFYKNSSFLRTPLGLTAINFIHQKLFGINAECPIPINFTSRVASCRNLSIYKDKSTLLSFAVSGQVYIQAINGITIGRNFLFAPGVKLISANHNFSNRDTPKKSPPIIIGNNVWLGANAVILPGVELADGCIVGAGAIVTKSFHNKRSIIAGNPAKLIKRY